MGKGRLQEANYCYKFNVKWEITMLVLDIWDVAAQTPNWYDIIYCSVWLQAAGSKSLSKFLRLILKPTHFTTYGIWYTELINTLLWLHSEHLLCVHRRIEYYFCSASSHLLRNDLTVYDMCITYIAELFMQIYIVGNCGWGILCFFHNIRTLFSLFNTHNMVAGFAPIYEGCIRFWYFM